MADQNTNNDPGGMLRWIIEKLLATDKEIGLYLLAALAVIFAAIMAHASGVTADGLQSFAIVVGGVALGAVVVIAVYKAIKSSPLVRILVNLLVLMGFLYIGAGFVQFMSSNRFHPPLQRAACFLAPFEAGCGLSPTVTAQQVDAAQTVEVAAPLPPIVAQRTTVSSTGETVSEEFLLEDTRPVPGNTIFVQFAGAVPRETVAEVSMALVEAGWNIQGADRGGERTGVAAGLNEVRYFRAEDREAAYRLAQAYAERAPWLNGAEMTLRDLSDAGFTPNQPDLLEVWTSLN
jgi:hypothetical protein